MTDLNQSLLAAHSAKDKPALVALYSEAAEGAATPDARAFFLTHAYVFALETGHIAAPKLKQALAAMGRETP